MPRNQHRDLYSHPFLPVLRAVTDEQPLGKLADPHAVLTQDDRAPIPRVTTVAFGADVDAGVVETLLTHDATRSYTLPPAAKILALKSASVVPASIRSAHFGYVVP